jgi:hypothetical protein
MRTPVALPPSSNGIERAMATANDHLIFKERCRIRAERSANEDVRRVWLSLAETYGTLSIIEKIELCGALISGKQFE